MSSLVDRVPEGRQAVDRLVRVRPRARLRVARAGRSARGVARRGRGGDHHERHGWAARSARCSGTARRTARCGVARRTAPRSAAAPSSRPGRSSRRSATCSIPVYIPRTLPAVVRLDRRHLHQPRVHPGQVVVLHEVLADRACSWPRSRRPCCATIRPLVEPVAGEPLRQVSELLGQRRARRRRGWRTRDSPTARRRRDEPVVGLVERADVVHVEHAALVGRDRPTRRRTAACPGRRRRAS